MQNLNKQRKTLQNTVQQTTEQYNRIYYTTILHYKKNYFNLMIGVKAQEVTLLIVKVRCTRDSRRHLFSNRVIQRWNQLGQEAVDATSINAFKTKLDRLRCVRMGFFMD